MSITASSFQCDLLKSKEQGALSKPAMLSLMHAVEAGALVALVWCCYNNSQWRCLSSLPLLPFLDPTVSLWASSLAFRQRLGDP